MRRDRRTTRPPGGGCLSVRGSTAAARRPGARGGPHYLFAVNARNGREMHEWELRTAAWQPSVAASGDVFVLATTFYYEEIRAHVPFPVPFGEPDGRLLCKRYDPISASYSDLWSLDLPAAIGKPVLSHHAGRQVVYFTACSQPPSGWFFWLPPIAAMWTSCSVWAIDVELASKASVFSREIAREAVLWQYEAPPGLALASLRVAGGAVFVSGTVFENGSAPEPFNCSVMRNKTDPKQMPWPKCDWPEWWPVECRVNVSFSS
eukprot:gene6117-20846_t